MDSTSDQPEGSIRRRRFTGSKLLSEDAFQNLRHHLATLGLALLLALPVAALVFFTVAAVRFAFDDRTFWNSQSNALAQFWYALALFVIVATPATFILLRRGYRAAAEFVVDRGYWKILLTIYVVLPLTVGVITVVAGHLVAVLVVLVLLLLFVVLNGGI